ncbi:hypothetical protein F4827_003436 [Paraburkholderia bannensis]|jgi:hypothetical protein|uniref:Uncharacterized protein n=1 Tax=Paraburkholderia bannensis TaxID=765414 RepID=A0A7W9TZJ5_9BURK|nr:MULTISPECIES: hypothetical protein [Paraburkholderia]MBB3258568.1 hypothetical protein [Paraburkholderia sp. WP4_3_2]MBB6103581.1 hypothetical protein [Paraburkholderia bannensis]
MSTSTSLAIDSLRGFELTADGQYLMVNGNQPDSVALHCSVLHEMLAALSNAIGRSERIRHKTASVKFAMPCEGWEVGRENGAVQHLVVSFRLPGGAELSFRLHPAQAAHMTEVLSLATGLARPLRPSGMRMQ